MIPKMAVTTVPSTGWSIKTQDGDHEALTSRVSAYMEMPLLKLYEVYPQVGFDSFSISSMASVRPARNVIFFLLSFPIACPHRFCKERHQCLAAEFHQAGGMRIAALLGNGII